MKEKPANDVMQFLNAKQAISVNANAQTL